MKKNTISIRKAQSIATSWETYTTKIQGISNDGQEEELINSDQVLNIYALP